MRSIALDGSLTAQIQTDERRYTLTEAAMQLREMGYDITPTPHTVPWMPTQPSNIEVELRTKCGCTKQVFLPRGMMTVHVACANDLLCALSTSTLSTSNVEVREFEYRFMEHRNGRPVAVFIER